MIEVSKRTENTAAILNEKKQNPNLIGVRKQKSLDVSYSSQILKHDKVRLGLRKTILLPSSILKILQPSTSADQDVRQIIAKHKSTKMNRKTEKIEEAHFGQRSQQQSSRFKEEVCHSNFTV